MRRSILRWEVRSMFSCSLVAVHVPAPYVIVGVTTASNRCNLCRCLEWDVSSCRCLSNADKRHRILCLHLGGFLVHNCDHLPQVLDLSFGRTYFDMHPVDLDVFQFVCLLYSQNLRFVWVKFEPLRFCTFLEVRDHSFFLNCFKEVAITSTSLDMQSFLVTQFDAQALFVPGFSVFLHR